METVDHRGQRTLINRISLLFLATLSQPSFAKGLELDVEQFLKIDFDNYSIAIAKVTSLDFNVFSPRFKQIKSISLEIKETIGSYPPRQLKSSLKCDVISDLDMIAPFEKQVLDKTLDIQVKEEVLVYMGFKGSKCSVVHLSKIKNKKIIFPRLKDQPEQVVELNKVNQIWGDDFKRSAKLKKKIFH